MLVRSKLKFILIKTCINTLLTMEQDPNCIIKAFENTNVYILQENIDNKIHYYFKASDIGEILELTNIRVSVQNYDEDEKVVRKAYSSNSGNQDILFLTSRGIYRLLYNSKKPLAKKFRKWVGDILDDIIFNQSKKLKEQLDNNLKLLQEKDSQLLLKTQEIEKIKAENKQCFYYIFKINATKYKIGICSSLENTLQTYRRNSNNTCFEWTYEFKDVCNSRICENIIKALLANYREKNNKETEIFNLDIELIKKVVITVVEYFDNTNLTNEQQITEFIKKFEKKIPIQEPIQEPKQEIQPKPIKEVKKEVYTINHKALNKSDKVLSEEEKNIIKEIINKNYEKSYDNLINTREIYDKLYEELKTSNKEIQERLQYTKPKNSTTGTLGYTGFYANNIKTILREMSIKFKESKVKNEKSGYFLKLRVQIPENM